MITKSHRYFNLFSISSFAVAQLVFLFGFPFTPQTGYAMSHEAVAGWDRFPQLDVLGSGTFGTVYLSRDLLPTSEYYNELVAVKVVALQRISDAEVKLAMSEVAILRELDHPNVLKFIDCFIDNDQLLCCVTEYVNGGDLAMLIKDAKHAHRFLDSFVVADMARQLLEGLSYLHSQAIIHRDIKPANIYLTSSGGIKIGDFGVSKLVSDITPEAVTFIGTPYYICPELARGESYSFGADVWALGVVLFELHVLRLPFFARNIMALMAIIAKGEYDSRAMETRAISEQQREGLLSSCGPEYVMKSESLASLVSSLVKSMLVVEKGSRLSAQEILSTFFGVSSQPPDESGLDQSVRASRANSIIEEDAHVYKSAPRQSLRTSCSSAGHLFVGQMSVGRSDPLADEDVVLVGGDADLDGKADVRVQGEVEYEDDFEEDEERGVAAQPEIPSPVNDHGDEDQSRRSCRLVVKISPSCPDSLSSSPSTANNVVVLQQTPRRHSSNAAVALAVASQTSRFRDPHAMERMLREKALKYHERRLALERKARERQEAHEQQQRKAFAEMSAPESTSSSQPNFAVAFGAVAGNAANVALGQSALAAKHFAVSLLSSASASKLSSSRKGGTRSAKTSQQDLTPNEDDEDEDEEDDCARRSLCAALVFFSSTSSETVPLRRLTTSTSFKRLIRRVFSIAHSRYPQHLQRSTGEGDEPKQLDIDTMAQVLRMTYLDSQGDLVEIGTAAEWRYVLAEHLAQAGRGQVLLLRCLGF